MLLPRTHHRFSVIEYDQMIEFGILTENDRVELIRGEIIEKMPIGDPHASCVKRCLRLFSSLIQDRATLSIQDPIRLPDSEPEPDVVLLEPRADFYASGKPVPDDLLLLIEVADSTLEFDREVKLPLYAENGIREYWIVNLQEECLEVHRNPAVDGTYRDCRTLRRGEEIELLALPGVRVSVEQVLG